MTDADQGKLMFTLVETIDELSSLPREQLLKDSDVISGAALSLMLIASSLVTLKLDDDVKMTVN